ncbi:hypothetical protein RBU61_07580 [Tissierella sp. MB52-C2]|uniref:hypothetical protein n=1 Tax=Tissierella sp. MB52-C2 TaxID=3070999 RepID=UPI00280B722E|nr:hypothetical protein [Tissierella sp. MB52-C2]WMM26524.1 hypothetical protein RBU61_07580 [Tissierella sp. MB52-C2]
MLLDILSKIDEKINSIKDTKLDLVGKDHIEKYLYIKIEKYLYIKNAMDEISKQVATEIQQKAIDNVNGSFSFDIRDTLSKICDFKDSNILDIGRNSGGLG